MQLYIIVHTVIQVGVSYSVVVTYFCKVSGIHVNLYYFVLLPSAFWRMHAIDLAFQRGHGIWRLLAPAAGSGWIFLYAREKPRDFFNRSIEKQ